MHSLHGRCRKANDGLQVSPQPRCGRDLHEREHDRCCGKLDLAAIVVENTLVTMLV